MKECPSCHSSLFQYATRDKSVISTEYSEFEMVKHVMKCTEHETLRSDVLSVMLSRYCTYANDMMVVSAVKRFIDGRS
ncbi:MAG: hypothetical protein QXP36_06180 [Conexivisphaerales archaeon]